jgi:hypothetical protein
MIGVSTYGKSSGVVVRLMVALCVLVGCLVVVSPALALEPWWSVSSTARPANLPPGGEGTIFVKAVNIGDETSSGDVTVSDTLPAGVVAQSVGLFSLSVGAGQVDLSVLGTCETSPGRVQCVYPEYLPTLLPYDYVELQVEVKVAPGAASGNGSVQVGGGAAPDASLVQPLVVSGEPTPFGVEEFRMVPEEEGGAVDTRAGSHPFQLSTTLALNQTADVSKPPALPKDFRFDLAPGLVGDATAVAQCSEQDFSQYAANGFGNFCPADTAIGVATVDIFTLNNIESYSVPLFNLAPTQGEPARFGFEVVRAPVIVDTAVRSGRDYGVVASSSNISQVVGLIDTQLTFWGVPGDPRHDSARGWACVAGGQDISFEEPCALQKQHNPAPLLTLPTACEGPLTTSLEGDSWPTAADPGGIVLPRMEYAPTDMFGRPLDMTGCDRLPFSPSIAVTPETHAGSTPTGLDVHVHLPQEATTSNASGLGEAAIRDSTVALPVGMSLDPSGAGGLAACSEGQVGFEGFGAGGMQLFTPTIGEPFCPDASKVGTARINVPILPNPLEGAVYVAAQNANPFGSLVALYIVANDPVSGVLVKIAGEVALDPVTGQLVSTFRDTPQAPVEDLELHFFGGPRGPLVTPAACGSYTTTGSFSPWSATAPVEGSSSFEVTSGPNGGACQSPAPFAPSLVAGMTSSQAGGFSAFTATFSREDSEQAIAGVSVTTPPGLLGILKGVERCGEAQANQGSCGAGSLIGHATAVAGAGAEPFVVQGGQVFLTGPYKGAPFGLSIVVPAVAGPYDLGDVVVRAAIHIDPHTAQITVISDPLPTILQGIPLQVRKVNVSIDRPGFMFNATSCEPFAVTGALTSTQGTTASVSSHYQAVNCAALPFKPSFKVSTQAHASRQNGASLTVNVGSGAGQANIGKVAVSLPKQLPSRLTTIQQACPEATFAVNPSSCPVGSNIGTATAMTPVLANPVTGPAYLVSHGGAAFPNLVLILQGEGVTLELVGSINIKKGVTSSAFTSVPDAPIDSFLLSLPEGPHSALTTALPAKAKGDLCGTALAMPTTITGQNGAVIQQQTKIAVTGCPKAKAKTKAKKKKHKSKVKAKRKRHKGREG